MPRHKKGWVDQYILPSMEWSNGDLHGTHSTDESSGIKGQVSTAPQGANKRRLHRKIGPVEFSLVCFLPYMFDVEEDGLLRPRHNVVLWERRVGSGKRVSIAV